MRRALLLMLAALLILAGLLVFWFAYDAVCAALGV